MASINPFGEDLPVADTTAVVKGSADATKLVRIEADGLTTATTRVLTMADQDIDLTPDSGTFAAAGAGGDTLPIVDTTAVVKGSVDATKLVRIEADGLTTATTRVITMADQDIDLTPDTGTFAAAGGGAAGLVFLSTVTASASATVDLETTFDSTFDAYMIQVTDLVQQTAGVSLRCRMKLGGAYDTGANYQYHLHRLRANVGTYASNISTTDTSLLINTSIGVLTADSMQLTMILTGVSGTVKHKHMQWQSSASASSTVAESFVGGGMNTSTTALTGIRLFMESGNITAGVFRLYGIVNS